MIAKRAYRANGKERSRRRPGQKTKRPTARSVVKPRAYERWDQGRVLGEIHRVYRQGGQLAYSRAPGRLVEAAIKYCGSWRRAIESAGLDYKSIRLPNNSGKLGQDIIAMLRERAKSGRIGIGPKGFITSSLGERARRRFGTIRAAVEAAGLDPDALGLAPRVRYNTEDAIVGELRRLMSEQPNMQLAKLHKLNVAEAVKMRHGSLQAGLLALGIEGWPQQRNFPLPSPGEVVVAIRERYRRGDPMAVASVMATERRLVKAAYKRFGTWRAAMRAAGLGAEIKDLDWNRAQVRAELRGRRQRGEANDSTAIQRDDAALWSGIVARYGGLSAALQDLDRARRRAARRRAARG